MSELGLIAGEDGEALLINFNDVAAVTPAEDNLALVIFKEGSEMRKLHPEGYEFTSLNADQVAKTIIEGLKTPANG